MSSKERTQRHDTSPSAQQAVRPETQRTDIPDPAHAAQQGRMASRLLTPGDVLQLQRTLGNQAVVQMIARTNGQPNSIQRTSSEDRVIQRFDFYEFLTKSNPNQNRHMADQNEKYIDQKKEIEQLLNLEGKLLNQAIREAAPHFDTVDKWISALNQYSNHELLLELRKAPYNIDSTTIAAWTNLRAARAALGQPRTHELIKEIYNLNTANRILRYAADHAANILRLIQTDEYGWDIVEKLEDNQVEDAKFFIALEHIGRNQLGNLASFQSQGTTVSINGHHFLTDHTFDKTSKKVLTTRYNAGKDTTFWAPDTPLETIQTTIQQAVEVYFQRRPNVLQAIERRVNLDTPEEAFNSGHGYLKLAVIGGGISLVEYYPKGVAGTIDFTNAETGQLIQLL